MDTVLILKRKSYKQVTVILLIVICFCVLCGCDPRSGQYPYDRESEWICDEPYFSLIYTRDSRGFLVATELLEWQDERVNVNVHFQSAHFWIYPEESNAYEDILLIGTWKYRRGNLEFIIEEDYVFDNQYSKLVFSPVDEG